MMYKHRTLLYGLSLKAVVRPPKQYIVLQERAKAPGFSTNQVPGEGGRGVGTSRRHLGDVCTILQQELTTLSGLDG